MTLPLKRFLPRSGSPKFSLAFLSSSFVRHVSPNVLAHSSSVSNGTESHFGFEAEDIATAKPLASIPGPRSYPVVGSLLAFKPFGDLDLFDAISRGSKLENRYGKIIRMHFPIMGMKDSVSLLDPRDFAIAFRNEGKYPRRPNSNILSVYREERKKGLGLFMTNGEEWWRFRQPLNKTMTRANAAYPYLDIQSLVGDELIQKIGMEVEGKDGRYPEIMKVMFRWALESVCAVVFDRRLGCMDPNLPSDAWQQKFIDSVHGAFATMFKLMFNPTHRIAYNLGYKTKKWRQMEEYMDYIDQTTLDLMHETKKILEADTDVDLNKRFLPQLFAADDLKLPDKVSVIFDMMLAAIDTTTYSMFRTLFFLAKNPNEQETLYTELNSVVGSPGSLITPTILSKLHYLKACIRESQRMKPIVPQNSRALPIDVVIKGYLIPKGTQIFVNHEYASMSLENFDDPHRFMPERWLRDKGKREMNVLPFIVLPFGFGPRMCIGRRFAEQELYIGLIKILQSFRVEYEGDKLPLKAPGIDKHPILLDFIFHKR